MMIKRTFLHLCLLYLLVDSWGEENAENLIGILGEPTTFLLKTSEQFTKVSWLTSKRKESPEIFVVVIPQKDPEERCELNDEIPTYRGRLGFSEDCKRLQISNLRQEDSGTYTAHFWIGVESKKETFSLRVYKRLLEADLEIVCDRKGSHGGDGTLQLNCSAGSWEDDATFSWDPASTDEFTRRSLVIKHNLEAKDLNFTCTVQNPVSKASKTVSLQKTCGGKELSSKNMCLNLLAAILTVEKVAVSICAGVLMWWKKQRAGDAAAPKTK